MLTHGELIRKLRTDRNISQRSLVTGICSRSTLATLENQGTYISADLLCQLLERMNFSLEDYWYLYTDKKNPKVAHFNELYHAFHENDLATITATVTLAKANFETNQDIFWLLIAFKGQELAAKLTQTFSYELFIQQEQPTIRRLSNYLMKVNNWSYFELFLFGNTVNYFQPEYVQKVETQFLEKLNLTIERHRDLYQRLMLNVGFYYIEQGALAACIASQKILQERLNHEDLHLSIMSRFLIDFCHELQGQPTSDYAYLAIYQQIGYDDYYQQIQQFKLRILEKG